MGWNSKRVVPFKWNFTPLKSRFYQLGARYLTKALHSLNFLFKALYHTVIALRAVILCTWRYFAVILSFSKCLRHRSVQNRR